MSTRDIDTLKNELLKNRIELSDTISQFMEKCNNNFSTIAEWGGGPDGVKGDDGDPGVPTKPKVPIHVWIAEKEYTSEHTTVDNSFTIEIKNENELKNSKYQEGHLIMLKNGHVYILEVDSNFDLKPKFILALQSYDPNSVINGKTAYVHIAFANSSDGSEDFKTAQELRGDSIEVEPATTFSLRRNVSSTYSNTDNEFSYMGIYSDNNEIQSTNYNKYTWIKTQGKIGPKGEKGDTGPQGIKGEKGDGYTGHPYTIDLEGDMSTISIDIDRTRLYSEDYCQCKVHAYYGNENVKINTSNITVNLPEEYKYSNDGTIVLISNENSKVGKIEKSQDNNDVIIKFIPDTSFIFPKNTIIFKLHIETNIYDENNQQTYEFERDTIWMIKGIMSTFELEIVPNYKTIKLFENGGYYPKKLLVSVYKIEDSERTVFDFSKNTDFTLLYKNYDSKNWLDYPSEGVFTEGVSCLEFKVVRYYNSTDPEKTEEMWDYEDVWVVADGKGTHYYHADLGSTESMMILTTGEKINIGTDDEPKYCADIKNESGYSITFDPKFYDGTEELEVTDLSIGTNSGEEYYTNKTFQRTLKKETIDGVTKYIFTITKVPYGIEVIPMNFTVTGNSPTYDEFGEIIDNEYTPKTDSISFNVYISTLSDTYTLIPTKSSYNTSTGTIGDKIGCNVYKNNTLIATEDLEKNGLILKYAVHDGGTDYEDAINYTEPLVYGHDDDSVKDEFTANDVAIEFILYYRNKEVVKSTVPLIKDGIDGEDGDSWQYIFCRSPKYPFDKTGISDPSTWTDNKPNDSNNDLLGNNGVADNNWYDDHKGVDKEFKYEYQSYRKWDKNNKCWGKYGTPTLYSNYGEQGNSYNVILSNPVATIPVGNDWSVNENNKNQSDSTLVYLYNNTTDISSNNNILISLPEDNIYVQKGNFTITKETGVNKVIFKPVVENSIFDFQSNAQYKLPITITYNLGEDNDNDGYADTFISTIYWSLTPIKGLNNVEIFVDKRVVNTSIAEQHSLKVGYYLISSNDTKKFIGNYNDEENVNKYKIILTDDINDLSSDKVVSDWQKATYDFVKNGENRNCYVVLIEESETSSIIDYTNVTSINDGKSAIHLELSQDYIELPCSANGNSVHPDYDVNAHPIHSKMMLYNGDTLIEDYNNITYSFKVDGSLINGFSLDGKGGFDVPTDIITRDMNIECIATYNGSSFHKTLIISLKETPYELSLSKNTLSRDINIGKITDKTLSVRVKYWMDGKWIYTPSGIVKANTSNGQENLQFGSPTGNTFDRLLMIDGSVLESNTVDTEVRISYYNDDVELSYETIGIINNGKNGNAPSCTSTKILGYSLNENEDIDNGTWVSLAELGTLNPGNPIYILNEYIWSDGTTTKVKSVTLAGTQGVDGKSRILFYLGSFDDRDGKTPTLEGNSVTGLLNDKRCDYYIDKSGNAWMRTGNNIEAIGSSSGNSGDINWIESETVGFLKAGAITAEMINTESIISDTGFISNLTAKQIETDEFKAIKISADQIEGGKIDADLIDVDSITADKINTESLISDTGFISNLTAKQIETDEFKAIKISADQIEGGKIDANLIDTSNIKTSVLETKSNTSDSIKIANNYIHCFNGNGSKNLIISSDELDTTKIDIILGSDYESNTSTSSNTLRDISLSKPSGSSIYTNTEVWYSHSSPINLGYILAGSTIDVYIALQAAKVISQSFNLGSLTQLLAASDWSISQGNGVVPYIVGGGSSTSRTGGIILIYKRNENGEWEEYNEKWLTGTWQDCLQPWTSTSGVGTKRYKCIIDSLSIQIAEHGEYAIRLGMEEGSINSSSNNIRSLEGLIKVNIDQKQPDTYTEIGKNGIVVYDGINTFKLDKSGVEMKSYTSFNSDKFFGWKVTSSGIFYCNDSNVWTQWKP